MRVAVCQMTSIDDPEFNFKQIEELLSKVKSMGGAEFISFPENALFLRLNEGQKIDGFELSDPIFKKISEIAKKMNSAIHIGATAVRMDGKLYNASVFISNEGLISCSYKKIHLFDIQLENQKPNSESDIFTHGSHPSLLSYADWQWGQTICYDLRFAELFNQYAKLGADVLLVPSSFLVTTGKAHWEVLLRARAIESQCYVLAAAQAGKHQSNSSAFRETYGHSMIVSPWGEILKESQIMGPDVLIYDLSRQEIQKVRKQIPMKSHRRL